MPEQSRQNTPPQTTPQRIRKYAKRTFAAALLVAIIVWTMDWLVLRSKIARDAEAYGQVAVTYHYAVHLRNRRTEQNSGYLKLEDCVHSMFPHYGDSPCWYLERHTDQTETLDGRGWHFWYDE